MSTATSPSLPNRHGMFIWYEYLAADVDAAADFYGRVMGWQAVPVAPVPDAYRRFEIGGQGVGGLARQVPGPGPCWLAFIGVEDVDATVERVRAEGGGVHVPPTDIPGIGRFAMVNDPQGAVFHVMRGASAEPSQAFSPGRVGHASHNELHTRESAKAFAFYRAVFGWNAHEAMDMGPLGTYQLFGTSAGEPLGGMMDSPNFPRPCWLTYFNVDEIGAAEARVRSAGGQVLHGPEEVPGGDWILQCLDSQGAMFALSGPRATGAA
jgi:predicted enzyme related to lactoylglutathione lyase